jgi:hypothetical protein
LKDIATDFGGSNIGQFVRIQRVAYHRNK